MMVYKSTYGMKNAFVQNRPLQTSETEVYIVEITWQQTPGVLDDQVCLMTM